MKQLFGVMVFQRSNADWRREAQGQSVIKLMQCSGLPEIYDSIGGGPSGKYEFTLTWVYVHSVTIWCTVSRYQCSLGGGGGVKLLQW